MNKKTHARALADGDERYYTGRPCRNKHDSERYTSSRQCIQCHKAYNKSEAVKKYNAEYRLKHRDRLLQQQREHHRRNRDENNRTRLAKYHATKHLPHEKAKKRAHNARRRAKLVKASMSLSYNEQRHMQMYYEQAPAMSEATGIPHAVDHFIPLHRGGKHHPDNLQIITSTKNRAKSCTCPDHKPRIRKSKRPLVLSITEES